jgi:spoIIIJ-associated protein
VSEELTVEATGETPRDAKWNAMRELERLAPSLDPTAVRFQVLSEGERGLLGVGASPARVLASVAVVDRPAAPPAPDDEPEAVRRVREMIVHVTAAMGLRCEIVVSENDDAIEAVCTGGDLGLLIGRHGQTIDAVQTLASAIASGGPDERRTVTVDAAGYRDRRRRSLEAAAARAADEVLRLRTPISLEPMSAAERKLVHQFLESYGGVATSSEGAEPDRRVVVCVA